MPRMHELVHNANVMFGPENIDGFPLDDLESLGRDSNFADAVERYELTKMAEALSYIRTWPPGMLSATSAAIRSALRRTPRMPITFAWAPGYDFEVTIWESAGISGSRGEMTILFRSRYPGDENPVTVRSSS